MKKINGLIYLIGINIVTLAIISCGGVIQSPVNDTYSTLSNQSAYDNQNDYQDGNLIDEIQGIWEVTYYYDIKAPNFHYAPDDNTQLIITDDSIMVFAEQYVIDGFGSTTQKVIIQTNAYQYKAVIPACLITDNDSLFISKAKDGFSIKGLQTGIVLTRF